MLMMALVAMLLVATGGSARAAQSRVSAGTGHASSTPPGGRPVAALPAVPSDQTPIHLDLASTPPVEPAVPVVLADVPAVRDEASHLAGDAVPAVGRGPPTV